MLSPRVTTLSSTSQSQALRSQHVSLILKHCVSVTFRVGFCVWALDISQVVQVWRTLIFIVPVLLKFRFFVIFGLWLFFFCNTDLWLQQWSFERLICSNRSEEFFCSISITSFDLLYISIDRSKRFEIQIHRLYSFLNSINHSLAFNASLTSVIGLSVIIKRLAFLSWKPFSQYLKTTK